MGVILGLAAGLRLWHIGAIGFNSDEAVYAGQAAAIAGNPTLTPIFPVFRAHPLLFQSLLAAIYRFGVSDLAARLLAVAFGVGTVALVYYAAKLIYGRRAGLAAGLFMAVMPYHVIVSRQALLDTPMTFFATLTLFLLARFASSGRTRKLRAVGAALGLTFLSKETALAFLPAIFAFLALSPTVRVRAREVGWSALLFLLVISPFPLALLLAGGKGTAKSYLIWQLFRRPNHDAGFYASILPFAVGPLVLAAAVATLWMLHRRWTWRENLLVAWIVVPFVFFQSWPVKGFQYLLPIAPALAILAGRAFVWGARGRARVLSVAAVTVTAISLAVPSWLSIGAAGAKPLAGTGGIPGGRAAGEWIRDNAPAGASLLTVGPSMANILEFYGHRQAYGLSVSPNPLHRNPSYVPVRNPDLQIRTGDVQYVVWDSFSAARSAFFADKILTLARRYHGFVVHTEFSTGKPAEPTIVIYEVRR